MSELQLSNCRVNQIVAADYIPALLPSQFLSSVAARTHEVRRLVS